MEPIVEWLRLVAKRVLSSYKRYTPELELSKCMMKYARKQYPEMMRQFRMSNIGKLGYSVYAALSEFITNAMNGPQFDELMAERVRIGSKVAQMTRYRPARMSSHSRAQQRRQSASARRRPQTNLTSGRLYRQPAQEMVIVGNTMTNRTVIVQSDNATSIDESRHNKEKRSLDAEPILYVGPRQFSSYPLPPPMQKPLNDDDEIDLANKPVGEIVEDLFDWEPIVLEGIGIDPKSMQKYSPLYCSKEYMLGFMKRFVDDFIMA